jgi:hypothetical protein
VFAWLLIKDRLNTEDLMLRENWNVDDGPAYVLYSVEVRDKRSHVLSMPVCHSLLGLQWHYLGFLEINVSMIYHDENSI